MPLAPARRLRRSLAAGVPLAALSAALAIALAGPMMPAIAATRGTTRPNLAKGAAYLVAPGNLIDGHYYQSLPRTADFGLTIDGALALAATGLKNQILNKIVGFIDDQGRDGKGKTVNDWTGIGTRFASGGAIAKEALLAEVVGDSPRSFGGHDLIAALKSSVCLRVSSGVSGPCPAVGSYSYSDSVFDQALGIIAQLRAGQAASAARPIAYLESLRNQNGSFPSLIPSQHDSDVDSTSMVMMALALVRSATARADVSSGLTWIARQQVSDGGFHGVGAISINSTGLAIQALSLDRARYSPSIGAALAFLGREQNGSGGFRADLTGQSGSDLRASAQAESGATGSSFGTLSRDLRPAPRVSRTGGFAWLWLVGLLAVVAVPLAGLALLLRRRGESPQRDRPTSAPHDKVRS